MLTLKPTMTALLISAASFSPMGTALADGSPPPMVQNLCATCHGTYGVAQMPGAANLSGQQHEYLREQLRSYRSGKRQSPHMTVVSKSLTDDDIELLSDWYSSIKVTVETPQQQ